MEVENNKEKSRFELKVLDKLCYLEYQVKLKSIIVAHTEVPVELSGQGLGKSLVCEAINYAKENNLKIIPVCKFTERYLNKHEEYNMLRGDI